MNWLLGILLFLTGIYFLGINIGIWSEIDFADYSKYWPLLLIILGVTIVSSPLKYGWIFVFLVLAASILFVYEFAIV